MVVEWSREAVGEVPHEAQLLLEAGLLPLVLRRDLGELSELAGSGHLHILVECWRDGGWLLQAEMVLLLLWVSSLLFEVEEAQGVGEAQHAKQRVLEALLRGGEARMGGLELVLRLILVREGHGQGLQDPVEQAHVLACLLFYPLPLLFCSEQFLRFCPLILF